MTDKNSKALDSLLSKIANDNDETIVVKLTESVLQQLSLVQKDLGDIYFTCKEQVNFSRGDDGVVGIKVGQLCKVTNFSSFRAVIRIGDSTVTFSYDEIDKFFVWNTTCLQHKVFENTIKEAFNERHQKLRELSKSFLKKEMFVVGDEVVWKSGLKYCIRPFDNEPAIVLEVLDKPYTYRDTDPDNARAGHINDIVIGVLDSDGELLQFLVDSRRFTMYKPK